tara:strand:- start:82 stop:1860 length:1779 start_codon:yes stop_codon:yes gene_type:complete
MFKIKKLLNNIVFTGNSFIYLKVVTIKRTIFLVCLSLMVMLFDTLSVLSIMPLLQFLDSNQNIENFIEATDYGKHLVYFFNVLNIPFELLYLSIFVCIFFVSRQAVNLFEILETEKTRLNISKALTVICFQRILSSSSGYIRKFKTGNFTSICEVECNRTSSLYKFLLAFTGAFFQMVAYICVMLYIAPVLTAGALTIFTIIIASMYFFVKKSHDAGKKVVNLRKTFYSSLSEYFGLWRLSKFGDLKSYETKKIKSLSSDYAFFQFSAVKYSASSRLLIAIIAMTLSVLLLSLSANYLTFDFSRITLFVLIVLRLIPLMQRLNGNFNSIASTIPSLSSLYSILKEADINKEDIYSGKTFSGLKKSIIFKNISFSYQSKREPVLNKLNLEIPANKVTAITGKSGSGKSTLVDFLPIFIEPKEGSILIDGVNINKFSKISLRKKIAFIPQDPLLFSGTIKDNIIYFNRNASNKKIKEALITSGSYEFVNNLPMGLDTILHERGMNLSGGQRQRVVLARAFITNAPILILDEATSALDSFSELRIKKTIEHLRKEKNVTVIIITHRLSTLKKVDYIAKLQNKKIVSFRVARETIK